MQTRHGIVPVKYVLRKISPQWRPRDVKKDCDEGIQQCHICDDFSCKDNILIQLIDENNAEYKIGQEIEENGKTYKILGIQMRKIAGSFWFWDLMLKERVDVY